MTQPWESIDDPGEHQWGAVAILDVGGVDHGVDQIALGVGEDVSFAPLDLFACIVTTRPSGFRGFDALAVDEVTATIAP